MPPLQSTSPGYQSTLHILAELEVPGAAFGQWLMVKGMKAQLFQIQDNFEAELRDASSPVGLGESSLLGTFLLLNFLPSALLPLPLYWLPPGSTTYLK